MKILYPDNITVHWADEENGSFPKENTADEHPKRVWKATSKDAQRKETVSSGNSLYIGNTNADNITVTVKNAAETETLWGPISHNLSGIDTIFELITDKGEAWDSLWVDYDYQADEHKVIIDYEMGAGIIETGIIRAGFSYNFKNPQYGISENLIDYSVKKELSNGAFYYRKRDIVRQFSGMIQVVRDPDFYTYYRKVMIASGPAPFACKLTDNENHDWSVFVRPEMPKGKHGKKDHSTINFVFIEVI